MHRADARRTLRRANGKHMANVRGELVPYIRLREHFDIPSRAPEIEQIMLVETEEGRYGFVVDQVLGNCQTVIKNLGRFYRHVQVVSRRDHPGQRNRGVDSRSRTAGPGGGARAHGSVRRPRAGGPRKKLEVKPLRMRQHWTEAVLRRPELSQLCVPKPPS